MTHFIPFNDELTAEDILPAMKRAVDAVRAIDLVLSSHALGTIGPQDVVDELYGLGLGKMTRGEILRGGGYA